MTPSPAVDLGALGLDRGGHIVLRHALDAWPSGTVVRVRGTHPDLGLHLRAWCRAQGHPYAPVPSEPHAHTVTVGEASRARYAHAQRAGSLHGVERTAVPQWGLAARGALVEAGAPAFDFTLVDRDAVWSDEAARLYAQAAAAQWDPATAIPWDAPLEHPDAVEDAVVQVMTYLIENETAALVVPARFLGRLHPHFREVMQLLAIQAADEARHIEVFTRRACMRREVLGLSTVGGQRSLQTLFEEPDFSLAVFLLSVLGEGSFLDLLAFLHTHAPDRVTAAVAKLSLQDEARHVAAGLAHLAHHTARDATLHARLALAVERRHAALADTAGLNADVFDALVVLAAGSWEPDAIARGFAAVTELHARMQHGRTLRLRRLGFTDAQAETLASLHTRNFM